MDLTALDRLDAVGGARAVREGRISALQWVEACLARIREVEPAVQAWQHLDERLALAQARARDDDRAAGRPLGALHGVPVGIKDIIDTADQPTESGTLLHAGRRPERDATVVALLRAAGAVILGKTVTTEMATYAPGKTRHPQDARRTPGGSSSGSAAAVAAGMVPLALGTQTNGSVIRPAAFCGVVGFKPTFGLVPRGGILVQSRHLDQVGVFGRSIDDVALLAQALIGQQDESNRDTRDPDAPPRIALVKTARWSLAEPATVHALADVAARLGDACRELELPAALDAAWDWHRTIMEAELAFNYEREWERGRERLSASLRSQLERGRAIRAFDYQHALAAQVRLAAIFDQVFASFDALLTPATPGTAPPIEATGDPVFCTLWTLAGLPALSLPLATGGDGLPLGLQLVGPRGGDARLLQVARWLMARVGGEARNAEVRR